LTPALVMSGGLFAPLAAGAQTDVRQAILSQSGEARYAIVLSSRAASGDSLAASELARYLHKISGATFSVSASGALKRVIVLRTADQGSQSDGYSIRVRGDSILLTGESPRALLYATYHFLEKLGCRWIAPRFEFYAGSAEKIPHRPTLVYSATTDIVERPRFAIRKLDVAEGLSHDTSSLSRIVEWMPKARFNTLQLPANFGGTGRVSWDAWRAFLAPELERRGIVIEVGGHGYQNFIRADMEGGKLFETHPDWFGKGADCKPSRASDLAFNTSNSGAVAYLTDRVVSYLRERPEIRVFDLWPPDGVRWAECKELEALGRPEERQAKLIVGVHDAIERARIPVRLEMIAYANTRSPPRETAIPRDVLVDFCPIGQNFDFQIDDPRGKNNAQYSKELREWRRSFSGDIGLYSYFRRYAWISLPVILPRYIQHDLRWYASLPLQGISTYAEPGDWFTYEVNHYAIARFAWNPDTDADSIVAEYASARYGAAAPDARAALEMLEDIVRVYGSVQYSSQHTVGELGAARMRLEAQRRAIASQARRSLPRDVIASLERLSLMLEFAARDLEIQQVRASGAPSESIISLIDALVPFFTSNRDSGVFLLRGRDDKARVRRHYGFRSPA
jgi:Glycosyl hydrolase family 67 N-terminus.